MPITDINLRVSLADAQAIKILIDYVLNLTGKENTIVDKGLRTLHAKVTDAMSSSNVTYEIKVRLTPDVDEAASDNLVLDVMDFCGCDSTGTSCTMEASVVVDGLFSVFLYGDANVYQWLEHVTAITDGKRNGKPVLTRHEWNENNLTYNKEVSA